jgi:PhzF family phenazine biosynthesis protein
VQKCGVGLVRIRRDGERLAFAAPPRIRSGPLDEADVQRIAHGLGVARDDIAAHAWCQNGPLWRGVMLRSAAQVLACKPDSAVLSGWDVGVVGPQTAAHDTQFEVRAFFTGNNGIAEDPVTGSLNAALAQWLIGDGIAPRRYVAAQGTAMGRAGRVFVQQDGPDIWIGGHSVTVVDGSVAL